MIGATPQYSGEIVLRELDRLIRGLEESFDADVAGFIGPLLPEADDVFLASVEAQRERGTDNGKLVMILTTLGGYIDVVHRIVDVMRHHYSAVEFVVPNYAFSAGTILVLSGDAIHMNYYSRLGPIDPQVQAASGRMVPAIGYLEQWERFIEKDRQGVLTTAETQFMLANFDPAELYQFEQERELSIELLEDWLAQYKFKNWNITEYRGIPVTDDMRRERAKEIASELNNVNRWKSHSRGISMEVLRKDLKLMIDDFDDIPELSGLIKSYYRLLNDYLENQGNEGVLHWNGWHSLF